MSTSFEVMERGKGRYMHEYKYTYYKRSSLSFTGSSLGNYVVTVYEINCVSVVGKRRGYVTTTEEYSHTPLRHTVGRQLGYEKVFQTP